MTLLDDDELETPDVGVAVDEQPGDETSLPDRLDSWAEESDPASAAVARRLSTDMREGRNLDEWSRIDLVSRLRAATSRRRSSVARTLTLVRNVVVFAPIAFTWLAISQASSTYGDFSEGLTAREAQRTFLYWWQQGMDGQLPAHFRLAAVAVVDVLLILLVIGLTIAAQIVDNRDEEFERVESQDRELVTSELLLDVELFLASVAYAAPATFRDHLGKAALDLAEASATVASVSEDLNETSKAAYAAIESQVALVTGELQRAVQQGADVIAKIDAVAAKQVDASVNIADTHRELSVSLGAINASLSAVAATLDAASSTLSGTQTSLRANMESASTSLVGASAELQSASSGAATSAVAMQDVSAKLEAAAQAAESLASQLPAAVDAITVASRAIAEQSSAIAGVTHQQVELDSQLREVVDGLRRTSASVELGTARLREDLDAIHAGLAPTTDGS